MGSGSNLEKDLGHASFEKWMPTFVKPDHPCNYCGSHGLDCQMYFGKITCASCNSLSRLCSFATVSTNASDQPETSNIMTGKHTPQLDTLRTVQEDACTERGAPTGVKTLRSNDSKRPAIRFSRAAVRLLRDWYEANINHPYPTDEEKLDLEAKTGLTSVQITTWLANTRRRTKIAKGRMQGYSPATSREAAPSQVPACTSNHAFPSQSIPIPASQIAKDWKDLDPFERWQHSPPENEPAPMDAIADAVKSINEANPLTHASSGLPASSNASLSEKQPVSIASTETGLESSNSRTGTASSIVWSQGSSGSYGSFQSFGSGLHAKRDRRRKKKIRLPIPRDLLDHMERIFQCTFCCDTFKTKYDWTRHEKTLHLSLENWICAPLGPIMTDPHNGLQICVYCGAEAPDQAHIEAHGHAECERKGLDARTFYRKDHLRQHLRLMHRIAMLPSMESWKASADRIRSRCGFCDMRFDSWSERNDHLAMHFREGKHMRQWKRCRGLDPDVAANVLNAMPPYLIGVERDSPVPFSASKGILSYKQTPTPQPRVDDKEGWIQVESSVYSDLNPNNKEATGWEILTISLGRFVKRKMDEGYVVTDDMIQAEGRRILYESDDPWNQTAADNPEWLDLFKKAHGLDIIPPTLDGVGNVVAEDLEFYGDLGLRVPCPVAQQAIAPTQPTSSSGNSGSASRSFGERFRQPRADGYKSYDEVPILAKRAAYLAALTRNPILRRDGEEMTAAQWILAQEGARMAPEQESEWERMTAEYTAQIAASHIAYGGRAVHQKDDDEAMMTDREMQGTTEDFGLAAVVDYQGVESSPPNSAGQMPPTPGLDEELSHTGFDSGTPGLGIEQAKDTALESDPMRWIHVDMMEGLEEGEQAAADRVEQQLG